jgi:NTE family protein
VLVASLGVATRVRPDPDLGPGVAVHRMTTPDLGVSMTDFSCTARHLDAGRAAAEALVDRLGREPVRMAAPRRSSIRLWDRRPRVS